MGAISKTAKAVGINPGVVKGQPDLEVIPSNKPISQHVAFPAISDQMQQHLAALNEHMFSLVASAVENYFSSPQSQSKYGAMENLFVEDPSDASYHFTVELKRGEQLLEVDLYCTKDIASDEALLLSYLDSVSGGYASEVSLKRDFFYDFCAQSGPRGFSSEFEGDPQNVAACVFWDPIREVEEFQFLNAAFTEAELAEFSAQGLQVRNATQEELITKLELEPAEIWWDDAGLENLCKTNINGHEYLLQNPPKNPAISYEFLSLEEKSAWQLDNLQRELEVPAYQADFSLSVEVEKGEAGRECEGTIIRVSKKFDAPRSFGDRGDVDVLVFEFDLAGISPEFRRQLLARNVSGTAPDQEKNLVNFIEAETKLMQQVKNSVDLLSRYKPCRTADSHHDFELIDQNQNAINALLKLFNGEDYLVNCTIACEGTFNIEPDVVRVPVLGAEPVEATDLRVSILPPVNAETSVEEVQEQELDFDLSKHSASCSINFLTQAREGYLTLMEKLTNGQKDTLESLVSKNVLEAIKKFDALLDLRASSIRGDLSRFQLAADEDSKDKIANDLRNTIDIVYSDFRQLLKSLNTEIDENYVADAGSLDKLINLTDQAFYDLEQHDQIIGTILEEVSKSLDACVNTYGREKFLDDLDLEGAAEEPEGAVSSVTADEPSAASAASSEQLEQIAAKNAETLTDFMGFLGDQFNPLVYEYFADQYSKDKKLVEVAGHCMEDLTQAANATRREAIYERSIFYHNRIVQFFESLKNFIEIVDERIPGHSFAADVPQRKDLNSEIFEVSISGESHWRELEKKLKTLFERIGGVAQRKKS